MRKIFKNLAILSLALLLASCGSKDSSKKAEDDTLKLGVVGERNVEYEDAIKRYEEDTDKHIEIVRFSDYNQPNDALKDGDIDLSSFATYIFIEDYNKNQNAGFTYLADSIISPMGVYSSKLKKVDELKEGSKVAIPVETSNNSRALYILEAAGVIKIKKDAGDFITVDDIEENPKNLEFIELPADQVSRALEDVDIALINSDMAMEAGLIPTQDSIFLEDPENERSKNFINVIAVKEENKDNEYIKNFIENYYLTDQTRKIIEEEYKGSVIPIFKTR
ncbi:MetQ/NlpA family ABC transporter substrate-binding protein [Anaerococcus prevotii]|uniref:Lipoprotein n=1 Tax=Anaerococcus prevotii ACS-065-V-Col13 TaxID=879305 RepID=F0GVH8_9FIRM|nr:MetQ/NlpA family ABC transporter substrate-binding protein [Anaerococcus prevotii]EGC82178.1 NLPA lipoprotein [Anaerococcus prevotii ACS-065-V-Col13]